MGAEIVGNDVSHPLLQDEFLPARHFAREFAFQTMDDVPLFAPMIGQIAFRIFDNSDSQSVELNRLPKGRPLFALVFDFGNRRPIDGLVLIFENTSGSANRSQLPQSSSAAPPGESGRFP